MKCLLNYVEVIRTHRKSGKYLIYILLIPNFYTFEYTYIHETQCLEKRHMLLPRLRMIFFFIQVIRRFFSIYINRME